MDVDSLRRMRSNIAQLFTPDDDSNFDQVVMSEDGSEDSVPSSLLSLPKFNALREIADKRQEIVTLENELDLKPFIKGFDAVQSVVYDGLELCNEAATCLEFLRSSSQILQQALKDQMAEDALPLPHHIHSKAIQVMEECVWIIKQRGWQPLAFNVEWEAILTKLEQEVSNIRSSSRVSELHLKEVVAFKSKLESFLASLSTFKRI